MTSTDRYRAAARAVRSAQFGREALAVARPRSVLGLLRDRGPLPVMLRVADAEGRLIWRGPDSFALLERPLALKPPDIARGGVRLRVLRFVDRRWMPLVWGTPPALLLLVSVIVALTASAVPIGIIALPLAAMVWIAIFLTGQLVQSSAWMRRTFGRHPAGPDELAAESYPGWNWSLRLFHHTAASPGEDLLRAVTERLGELVRRDARQVLERTGAEADGLRVREVLVVPLDGVTTEPMRAVVRDRLDMPFGPESRVALKRPSDFVREKVREPVADGGGFLFFWVGGVTVVLAVLAYFVTVWEQAGGRSIGYLDALSWLAWRLLLQDGNDTVPDSWQASVIGWLVSILGLTTVGVVVVAMRQAVKRNSAVITTFKKWGISPVDSRVLIVTVTDTERRAVFEALDRTPERTYAENLVVYDFGLFGSTQVALVQSARQGAGGPGGAQATIADAVRLWRPGTVVMAGICCGLREDWTPPHRLADVVVAASVYDLDHRIRYEDRTEILGDRASPHTRLIQRLRDASIDFPAAAVHIGPVLSSRTLLDSRSHRDDLKREHSRALAYEMEAQGLYAACADAEVPWIMVKAISDWGVDREEFYEPAAAARNSAAFVRHALDLGAFRPARQT
jgi:nucleoside phosphorylase